MKPSQESSTIRMVLVLYAHCSAAFGRVFLQKHPNIPTQTLCASPLSLPLSVFFFFFRARVLTVRSPTIPGTVREGARARTRAGLRSTQMRQRGAGGGGAGAREQGDLQGRTRGEG